MLNWARLLQDRRIHMSESDFVNITQNGALCNAKGEIGSGEFQAIMRRERREVASCC